MQAKEGDGRQHREEDKHRFPRRVMHPGRAHQRPEQRRDQRYVGHQRGDFNAHRLLERFLDRRIPHRADKAQADALQKAQEGELLDILRQQRGKAGEDKPHHAGQHYRTAADAVGERP